MIKTLRSHWFIIFIIFIVLSCRVLASWRPGEMKVKVTVSSPQSIKDISQLGIEIEHSHFPAVYVFVIPEELAKLKNLKFQTEVVIPDMGAYSRQLLANPDLIGYHDYYSTLTLVDSLLLACPEIIMKVIFGKSVEGRQLYAVKISDRVQVDEPEPEIGFDGCHHGDEIMGAEVLVQLMRDLCRNYTRDSRITNLVNTREIWIFPFVNPDGRQALTRRNANYVDLNRDWGYMWDGWGNSETPYSQPETRAAFSWILNNQFVVHQSMHTGSEIISYPWSYRPDLSPDHIQINSLAREYATASKYPALEYGPGFDKLYPIRGNAKDSFYGLRGSLAWAMELSEQKTLPSSEIARAYTHNREALLAAIENAGQGISGKIVDAQHGTPVKAVIWVQQDSREYWPVYNDPLVGDFHKYLLPGKYRLTVKANGYQTRTLEDITVPDSGAAEIDVQLTPRAGLYAYQVIACRVPGNNFPDRGYTHRILGEPDGRGYSLGKNGWIVADMGSPVYDLPGNDLRIVEADDSPEGYTVQIAEHWSGPWTTVGEGHGTREFDIAASDTWKFRYLRLEDDGDGFPGTAHAGFDVDAIAAELSPPAEPYLTLHDIVVIDTLNNFNGIAEAGETVDLMLKLQNLGSAEIKHLSFSMNCEHAGITLLQPNAELTLVGEGAAASIGPFRLHIKPDVPHLTRIPLQVDMIAEDGRHWQQTVVFTIHGGARIAARSASLHFSDSFINFRSRKPLELFNNGADTLKIFQFRTTQTVFWVETPQLLIAPGEARTVTVHFQPSDSSFFQDTLTILSNDPQKYLYKIALSGFGTFFPTLETSLDSIALSAHPDDSLDVAFSIKNIGAGPLNCEAILISDTSGYQPSRPGVGDAFGYVWDDSLNGSAYRFSWIDSTQKHIRRGIRFTLHQQSGSIAAGSSRSLRLQAVFDNCPEGDWRAVISIKSNDPHQRSRLIPIRIHVSGDVLVAKETAVIPERLMLLQNYPNPFNPATTIEFQLPARATTKLIIYNTLGQAVRILIDDELPAGEYRVSWEAVNEFGQKLPSGIYFYELRANEYSRIKKMILLH